MGEVSISVVFTSIQSDTFNVRKNSSCLLSVADYSYKLEVVVIMIVVIIPPAPLEGGILFYLSPSVPRYFLSHFSQQLLMAEI